MDEILELHSRDDACDIASLIDFAHEGVVIRQHRVFIRIDARRLTEGHIRKFRCHFLCRFTVAEAVCKNHLTAVIDELPDEVLCIIRTHIREGLCLDSIAKLNMQCLLCPHEICSIRRRHITIIDEADLDLTKCLLPDRTGLHEEGEKHHGDDSHNRNDRYVMLPHVSSSFLSCL